ncbi:X-linked retinitis pigmentosa GTPase regulator-interacting protein 1 isoform X2 [Ascaphus truei]|uniref:X-linked retinitis pigmentosa GTPase regulator-interacting protein 1 isoform X2 n=1 Tax=Ascaphus truei TaxID=8439 RepID=UPI003F5957E1
MQVTVETKRDPQGEKMSLLLVDDTSSDIPVRDTDSKPAVIRAIQDVVKGSHAQRQQTERTPRMREKDLKTRRRVSLISREELEDNFLRLHEENLLLKDYARKQEGKMKRMATKLLRMTSDLGQTGDSKTAGRKMDGRDLEAEETIEDLQDRVRDLEHRNEALRHQLTIYKQRLQVQNGCRHCPYGTVSARTDSGVRRNATLPEKTRRGLRVQGPEMRPLRVATVGYEEALGDEARAEIDRLVRVIESQNGKVDELERSSILLKNIAAMRSKDAGTEMMLSLQRLQQAEDQRTAIQENVIQIRLQRDLREKSTSLGALREQFQQLKESYETELQEQKSLTLSHNAVLTQLEDLSSQLKAERAKVLQMEVEQKSVLNLQRSLLEFQERIGDLEKDKEFLKANYETLLKSSLDSERLSSWQVTEEELRGQILQLEGQLHSHLSDKTLSEEHLQRDKEQNKYLTQEVSRLQNQLVEKFQEVHELQEKVLTIVSSTTTKGVQQEQEVTSHRAKSPSLEGYCRLQEMKEDEERCREDREKRRNAEEEKREYRPYEEEERKKEGEEERWRKIREMDAAHAETILELEKTREMLFLQHTINKDYQEELQTVRLRAESESREREERERHCEDRLLQRSSRIQILEAQLKDIAYGTFAPRILAAEPASSDVDSFPPPSLHRGETLFEVHIGGICFTPRGLREPEDPKPTTFCIYSLYDFEMHATPVVTGAQPEYNFTSCYAVTPDCDFLRYLRVGVLTVELYQAVGGEHRELAKGRVGLEATIESRDRVYGTVTLTDASGENMGELDYWLRLHGPLSQTQRLQKQRVKARGYLSTHRQHRTEKPWTLPLSNGPQNELIIRIWGCRSLKVGRPGYQPSPYAMYHFYHHPDHSTSIIPCSNNPQFGDEISYPLNLTIDVERYLQRERLYVYVFDDEETQPGGYLGRAEVPLLRLAQGNDIQGDYALLDPCGRCSGSLQLSLEWKIPYQVPGHCLWESSSGGRPTPEKPPEIPISQHRFQGKLLPRDAPQIPLTRSKPSKSRKADEELRTDMHSSKRGRRDPHLVSYQRPEQQRPIPSPAGHPREESDMDVEGLEFEEIAAKKEVQEKKLQEHDAEQEVCLREQEMHEAEQEESSQHSTVEEDKTISLARHITSEEDGDQTTDFSESQSTDSDDIIVVAKPQIPPKPPSSRIRVEVASLTFDPCSEVVGDSAVQRVFVEFRFAGVPFEETETPLSLRKPNRGEEIYYHFSKVIHLDGVEHAERRQFLYALLEGSDAGGENVRLKFTVVSDPINEEQEECQDVGYAYLDLRPLLRRAEDPTEETLQIVDASDQREVIGALRVVVEARDAARAVYRERRGHRVREQLQG